MRSKNRDSKCIKQGHDWQAKLAGWYCRHCRRIVNYQDYPIEKKPSEELGLNV